MQEFVLRFVLGSKDDHILLLKWFFKNHKTFEKHDLIDSLKELLLIINVMTFVVTQKTFINPFASWMFTPFLLQSTLVIDTGVHYFIALTIMTSHIPIFLSCIHPFIFFSSYFLLFPFQFSFWIKPSPFPWLHGLAISTTWLWDLFTYSPTNIFVPNHVEWCGIP